MDNLINCKIFDSNACYETKITEEVTSWMCFGCGFGTSTMMSEGSEAVANAIETAPELFKEIREANEGLVWFPSTITVPNAGMVFLDGTSKKDLYWSAVKSIPLSEEELKSEKFPAEQTTKMDMKNAKRFPSEKGFIDALDDIGFFGIDFAKPLT